MKLKITAFTIAGLFITAFFSHVMTSSPQPPAQRTGAPGESTCGTSTCHNISTNLGDGSVTISLADSLYAYDSTYIITVQVNNTNQSRFGFELTALEDSNDTKAGTLAIIDSSTTALQTASGRQYISHKNAGSNSQWSFEWNSPSQNLGSVTFYATGNAANSNGTSTGDTIYKTSLTIQPDTTKQPDTTFITDPPTGLSPAVKVYPNPARHYLWLTYTTQTAGQAKTVLINQQGQVVTRIFNNHHTKGHHEKRLALPAHLSSGLYFIKIEQKNRSSFRKFYIK